MKFINVFISLSLALGIGFISFLGFAPAQAGPAITNKTSAPSGTQMVIIGDAGNQPDEWGHGSCKKNFAIGAYEWTVADWKVMLDDVASKVDPLHLVADPHGLWNERMQPWITRKGTAVGGYCYEIVPGAENLPITYVNFYDICRACNYMQNKEKLSSWETLFVDSITEHGAYEIAVHDGHSQEVKETLYAR